MTDRSKWPSGPWDGEPDGAIEFEHKGLPCMLHRGPLGAWCGYVGLPAGHPWFGKNCSDRVPFTDAMRARMTSIDHVSVLGLFCEALVPGEEGTMQLDCAVRVHGGVTYARDREPFGKPDGRWGLGFDCSHSGDLVPPLARTLLFRGDTYRDIAYARAEAEQLAEQALEAAA